MRRKVIDPRISVAIVVLAAGRSSRMVEGRRHKLLALFDGQSLVRRSVSTALASDCGSVVVVTGHRSTEIAAQVRDLPCEVIHNAEYASGIAGSLRTGVKAASKGCPGGIMIMLADMPRLSTGHVDTLIAAFRSGQGRDQCINMHRARRWKRIARQSRHLPSRPLQRSSNSDRRCRRSFADRNGKRSGP